MRGCADAGRRVMGYLVFRSKCNGRGFSCFGRHGFRCGTLTQVSLQDWGVGWWWCWMTSETQELH